MAATFRASRALPFGPRPTTSQRTIILLGLRWTSALLIYFMLGQYSRAGHASFSFDHIESHGLRNCIYLQATTDSESLSRTTTSTICNTVLLDNRTSQLSPLFSFANDSDLSHNSYNFVHSTIPSVVPLRTAYDFHR
ncbi:hypothetical protein FKP32DRAFT_913725 [Trametes sanguinea]|nr:hypothetical protein FKP32DRAFT_913725 [Trametes sanguinea]